MHALSCFRMEWTLIGDHCFGCIRARSPQEVSSLLTAISVPRSEVAANWREERAKRRMGQMQTLADYSFSTIRLTEASVNLSGFIPPDQARQAAVGSRKSNAQIGLNLKPDRVTKAELRHNCGKMAKLSWQTRQNPGECPVQG